MRARMCVTRFFYFRDEHLGTTGLFRRIATKRRDVRDAGWTYA